MYGDLSQMKKPELLKMLPQPWIWFGLDWRGNSCDVIWSPQSCCESVWAELLGKISEMKPTENKIEQGLFAGDFGITPCVPPHPWLLGNTLPASPLCLWQHEAACGWVGGRGKQWCCWLVDLLPLVSWPAGFGDCWCNPVLSVVVFVKQSACQLAGLVGCEPSDDFAKDSRRCFFPPLLREII